MSFGEELSNEFHKLTYGVFHEEVELFTKLQDAFINMKYHSKYRLAIDVIHGSKSFVKFDHSATYVSNPAPGVSVTRELSDMLFIVFQTKGTPEIRLMYMQNKRGESESKFLADLLQLHLLRERKIITSAQLPDCVFGNSNILADAVLPSVGSYGVFYKTNVPKIEMAYYPASRIQPRNPTGGKSRIVYYEDLLFGQVDIISGHRESQGERTLEAFADALVDMKIGTPMLGTNPATRRLAQFLYANSNVFKEGHPVFDIPPEYDLPVPEHMPVTCVINADLISKFENH